MRDNRISRHLNTTIIHVPEENYEPVGQTTLPHAVPRPRRGDFGLLSEDGSCTALLALLRYVWTTEYLARVLTLLGVGGQPLFATGDAVYLRVSPRSTSLLHSKLPISITLR